MTNTVEHNDIDQLMTEADALIQQIHSDALNDMQDEQQRLFEKHAEDLKRLKARIHSDGDSTEPPESTSSAEGMHQAILDIISAMQDLKNKIL